MSLFKIRFPRKELSVYDELVDFCNITGLSKTMAVERALSLLISEHYKREAIIMKAIDEQK